MSSGNSFSRFTKIKINMNKFWMIGISIQFLVTHFNHIDSMRRLLIFIVATIDRLLSLKTSSNLVFIHPGQSPSSTVALNFRSNFSHFTAITNQWKSKKKRISVLCVAFFLNGAFFKRKQCHNKFKNSFSLFYQLLNLFKSWQCWCANKPHVKNADCKIIEFKWSSSIPSNTYLHALMSQKKSSPPLKASQKLFLEWRNKRDYWPVEIYYLSFAFFWRAAKH